MPERMIAACDGAAKGNPGPAGWAWVLADVAEREVRWQSGPLGDSTNNVAELTALERLLSSTPAEVALEVRMDSQYAMKAVTSWLPAWKKNGWQTSSRKPVANRDLIVRIDALLSRRDVRFVYVRAHQVDGDRLNALADRAASEAALSQRAASGTETGEVLADLTAGAARGTGGARRAARSERPAAGDKKAPARSIKARFAGTCRCGQPYQVGDLIAKASQGWGHPACATGALE